LNLVTRRGFAARGESAAIIEITQESTNSRCPKEVCTRDLDDVKVRFILKDYTFVARMESALLNVGHARSKQFLGIHQTI
jgi:hypothetical protein